MIFLWITIFLRNPFRDLLENIFRILFEILLHITSWIRFAMLSWFPNVIFTWHPFAVFFTEFLPVDIPGKLLKNSRKLHEKHQEALLHNSGVNNCEKCLDNLLKRPRDRLRENIFKGLCWFSEFHLKLQIVLYVTTLESYLSRSPYCKKIVLSNSHWNQAIINIKPSLVSVVCCIFARIWLNRNRKISLVGPSFWTPHLSMGW